MRNADSITAFAAASILSGLSTASFAQPELASIDKYDEMLPATARTDVKPVKLLGLDEKLKRYCEVHATFGDQRCTHISFTPEDPNAAKPLGHPSFR